MYKYAAGYLRAKSYEHYEVSSYAYAGATVIDDDNHNEYHRDDDDNIQEESSSLDTIVLHKETYYDNPTETWRSRHNQIYWDYNSSWYAVGLGATSFVNGKLLARPRPMDDYIKWVMTNNQRILLPMTSNQSTTSNSSSSDDHRRRRQG